MISRWSAVAVNRVTRLTLGVSLAIGMPACKSKTDTATAPSAAPAKPPPAPKGSASASASASARAATSASAMPAGSASAGSAQNASIRPIEVELVDAGKPPLRPVRFAMPQEQTVRWTATSRGTLQYEGLDLPSHPLPGSRQVVEMTVTKAMDKGPVETRVRVLESAVEAAGGVPRPILERARQAAEAEKTYSGNQSVSAAGLVLLGVPPGSPPPGDETRERVRGAEIGIAQTLVPFPDQPIGVGARWTVVRGYDLFGVSVRELTVYEVLKMDDRGLEFDGLVSASAAPVQLEQFDLPPDHTLHLTRLFVLGNVKGKVSFTHPVPTETAKSTMKWSVRLRHVDDVVAEGKIVMEVEREITPEVVAPPPGSASALTPAPSGSAR